MAPAEGYVYVLPHLLVGVMVALLGVVTVLREKASYPSLFFCTMAFIGAAWQLSYVRIFRAPDEALALAWCRIENVAVVFIPTAVLWFTLSLLGRLRAYRLLAWSCLLVSAVFCALIIATDGFVEGVYRYPWGYFARYGPWTLPFLAFFFSVLLLSLFLYGVEYRRAASPLQRKRLRALLIAFGIAYLGSVDYLPAYGIPVYPAGYLPILIFCVIVARTLWRYRLVEITPAFAAKQILKTLADALLVLDREGTIRVANQAACELLGRSEKQLLGKPIWSVSSELLPGERFQALVRAKVVQSFETTYSGKEGEAVPLEVSASSLRDERDLTVGIVCIARDIAGRKPAEDALEKHPVQ